MDSSFETDVRQFFVLHFKWTPTREEHKIFVSVFEWITLLCKTWRFQTIQNSMPRCLDRLAVYKCAL
jgi:hypothetical protein